jgi:hypothetical protein
METILKGLTYELRHIYLDDLFVIGRTFQEHLLNLQKVFQRVREAQLKLIPEMCKMFQKDLRCLRHTVSPEWVTTDPKKLQPVWECQTPKNKHEMRNFLHRCTYYKRFIFGFRQRREAFQWNQIVVAAFQTLK